MYCEQIDHISKVFINSVPTSNPENSFERIFILISEEGNHVKHQLG